MERDLTTLIKLNELKNGDFRNVNIDNWFTSLIYDRDNEIYFKYIKATLQGLDKVINSDLLNLIAIYADHFLRKCASDDKLIFKNNYELFSHLLEKVIIICTNHSEYNFIVQRFYNHPLMIVRLYCAANGNYIPFLNDSEKRVRKVATIREEFLKNYRYANDLKKERIKFLTNALNFNAIATDYEYYDNEEIEDATFYSTLFSKEFITIENFDKDILYRINDKRILASKIEEYIIENNIHLNWDMLPDCFNEIKDISRKRIIG